MKTTMRKRTLFASLFLAASLSYADYSAWSGSRDIILDTSPSGADVAGDVHNFPVLIRLTDDEAAIMLASRPGGADIRFSKADGVTPLPYEIENWEPWGAAIWVLVDTVYGNNSTQFITMHWGNPAANSESNGSVVFDTAFGYVGAWHFGNGAGSLRPSAVAGAPFAFVHNSDNATSVRGLIGRADTLRHFSIEASSESSDPAAGNWIELNRDSVGVPLATPYAGYTAFPNGLSYSLWTRPSGDGAAHWRMLVLAPDDATQAADRILFMGSVGGSQTRTAVRWTSGCGWVDGPNPCNFDNATTNDAWNHIFVTKEAGSGPVLFYVNGELVGSSSNVANATEVERSVAWIGRAGDNNPYFTGLIDNATLANTHRSADFIKLSYENQKEANTLVDIGLGGPVTSTPYGAWSDHRTITLNTSASGANVAGDVYNFPVLVRLTQVEEPIMSASKAEGADIRFSKIDDATPLTFHIESWDSTGAAIWVLVDTVYGNNSTQAIRMHWGNPAADSESNAAAVFDTANGYRAVWQMNEPSGDVTDATANAVVATNVGTTTAPGLAGPGRRFAGTNAANTDETEGRQYLDVGNPDALNFTGLISMSAWVRWTHVAGTENESYYRTFINRDGSSPSAEVFLRIGHNAGNAEHAVYTTGQYTGSADIMPQSPQLAAQYPDSAVWTHLVGVFDSVGPSQRIWRLYRNGVQIAASEHDADAGVFNAPTLWRIGRGPGSQNARWFVGDMDEVRISNVTRDSNYVRLSYQNQKPGNSLVDIGTYIEPTPPGPPTAVTAALHATIAGVATVSWTAPLNDGAATINSYTVTGTPSGSCMASGAATSCAISGLTPGNYTFTVTATNSVGTGAASAPSASLTVPEPESSILPGSFVIRMDGTNPYSYRIPAAAAAVTERLSMSIYDVYGRQVWSRTIAPNSGVNELTWNGRTTSGAMASAGMYIVRINAKMTDGTREAVRRGVTLNP